MQSKPSLPIPHGNRAPIIPFEIGPHSYRVKRDLINTTPRAASLRAFNRARNIRLIAVRPHEQIIYPLEGPLLSIIAATADGC